MNIRDSNGRNWENFVNNRDGSYELEKKEGKNKKIWWEKSTCE